MKRKWSNGLFRFFRLVYLKLCRINDSPQRIALGFGLGVFLGILPGTGPVAAFVLAFIFRVNRASSLVGALLTNTWLSIVTLVFSIKIGSFIMGLDWQKEYAFYKELFRNIHGLDLLKLSVLKIFLPAVLGYFVVSVCLGFMAYVASLIVLHCVKPAQNHPCTSLKK